MASLSSDIHNNGVSGLHSFSILQNIHILRNMLLALVCTLKTEQYFECVFNVFMLYSHNWCKMYHTYNRCPKSTHSIEFNFIFCNSLISCFTSLALYASSVSSWRCIWNRMVNNYLHVNMIFIVLLLIFLKPQLICLNSHEWKMFVMLSFMCYDCYYKATTKFLASEIWSVIL